MKKIHDDEEAVFPVDLVAAFSRAVNYPRDQNGVQLLAQGLAKASRATSASMRAIVDRCLELSDRCPTDFEMIKAGESIKGPITVKAPMGCEKCQGSGWFSFQKEVEPIPGAPYMADYARHCDCEAGQFLAAAERKREEERRAKQDKQAGRRV